MRESQLKEYLGIASEMEQTCFLQEQLRLNLESKYKCLGIPKNIPRPILEEVRSSFGISTIGIGLLFGAIAWFIAGFFYMEILMVMIQELLSLFLLFVAL